MELDKLTNEELGKLFPIIISEPVTDWINLFNTEKHEIENAIGLKNIVRIEHIGSTAVPKLKSKPTIDIILELADDTDKETIMAILKTLDYQYIHRPDNPPPHMMFVKGYTTQGFLGQAYHIHVRYKGDWDEYYFRDYLIQNSEIAQEYEALKLKLAEEYKNDREAYTENKTNFIKGITALARKEKYTSNKPVGVGNNYKKTDMRNILFALTLTLIMSNTFGQSEQPIYKVVADKFENEYNQSNYDSIFTMFSIEMQNALPIDKTKEFLKGLKSQAGQITQREFINYENQSYASYKTKFERGLLSVNISVDNNSKINGLYVKPFKSDNFLKIVRNKTKLILPFNDTWNVFWGGDTKGLNYHVDNEAQKNAFDFIILDKSGKSYKTDGKTNEDYYAFGKELIAPCDGEIVVVIDGVKDNIPGEMNYFDLGGNTIILKTANNEYLVFCHLKHQSIKIKEGQKIVQGQLLGLCGNTGHSSEAHLHFHIQNVEDINKATGVKCYFDNIVVNGQLKNDYSPVKNEIIKNEKR